MLQAMPETTSERIRIFAPFLIGAPLVFFGRQILGSLFRVAVPLLIGAGLIAAIIFLPHFIAAMAPHIATASAVATAVGTALAMSSAWTALHLFVVASLRFFVPPAIALATNRAVPTLATILPGVLATAAVQYDLDPEVSNAERGLRVAGAAGALLVGLRSTSYLPKFASALRLGASSLSGPWLLATSFACAAGQMAASTAYETRYPRPHT